MLIMYSYAHTCAIVISCLRFKYLQFKSRIVHSYKIKHGYLVDIRYYIQNHIHFTVYSMSTRWPPHVVYNNIIYDMILTSGLIQRMAHCWIWMGSVVKTYRSLNHCRFYKKKKNIFSKHTLVYIRHSWILFENIKICSISKTEILI